MVLLEKLQGFGLVFFYETFHGAAYNVLQLQPLDKKFFSFDGTLHMAAGETPQPQLLQFQALFQRKMVPENKNVHRKKGINRPLTCIEDHRNFDFVTSPARGGQCGLTLG